MPESESISIPLDLSWADDENGVLVITGCASVPKPDRENELVTKEAIEAALPDFMKLAVLHLDHTERPLGPITEAWFDGDKFMIKCPIKMTPDCKDVRDRIREGELGQLSIYGRRNEGTPSCKLHPNRRSETCQTRSLFLDSISLCPSGNAINENSYIEHNGGIVVKSMNSESAIETADGSLEKNDMVENVDAPAESAPTGDLNQEIVEALSGINDRLAAVEQTIEEMTSVEPEDIEKAEEDYDGAEYDAGPDLQEQVSTLAEGMTMILQELAELKEQISGGSVQKAELEDEEEEDYPDDGYEEEEDEEPPVEKGCSIKKAFPDLPEEIRKAIASIPNLNETIQKQTEEIGILRKAVLELEQSNPRDRKVIIDKKIVDSEDIVKKSQTPESSGDSQNPAALMAMQF
jgi:hypothetical protein